MPLGLSPIKVGKRLLSAALRQLGYELKLMEAPLRGYSTFLTQCKRRGLSVRTVLDAGVGRGTPWLYEAFPDVDVVLFEPLRCFEPDVDRLKKAYRIVDCHFTALAERNGAAEIHIPREFSTSASLKMHSQNLLEALERDGVPRTYEREQVPTARLDDLNRYHPPFLLKIDVEGSELSLLKGAVRTLEQCALIIVETSLVERYENGCTFIDVAGFLHAHGFALYEIVEMGVRKSTAPVSFLDAAFVPSDSPLRRL